LPVFHRQLRPGRRCARASAKSPPPARRPAGATRLTSPHPMRPRRRGTRSPSKQHFPSRACAPDLRVSATIGVEQKQGPILTPRRAETAPPRRRPPGRRWRPTGRPAGPSPVPFDRRDHRLRQGRRSACIIAAQGAHGSGRRKGAGPLSPRRLAPPVNSLRSWARREKTGAGGPSARRRARPASVSIDEKAGAERPRSSPATARLRAAGPIEREKGGRRLRRAGATRGGGGGRGAAAFMARLSRLSGARGSNPAQT
jgi:hypothetical protein